LTPIITLRQDATSAIAAFFQGFRVVLYQPLMRLHFLLDDDRQNASGVDANKHGLWF